jgi:cytochrome b6-f complex iron-sulfur subunit
MAGAKQKATRPTRRSFLRTLWIGLGVVAVAESVGLAVAFLRPWKPKLAAGSFGGVIVAGSMDQFEPGSVTAFRRGQFYLVRLEDGGFLALSRKCTHLGCTVNWRDDQQQFICPCHASVFDSTGSVLTAPAPRPLDLFEIRIENRIIKVDTEKPLRRNMSDESQIARA